MHAPLAVFTLRSGERDAHSSTRGGRFGARTAMIETAVPELGLVVHSAYLGARQAGTHAAHLILAPRGSYFDTEDHDARVLSLEITAAA